MKMNEIVERDMARASNGDQPYVSRCPMLDPACTAPSVYIKAMLRSPMRGRIDANTAKQVYANWANEHITVCKRCREYAGRKETEFGKREQVINVLEKSRRI